MNYTQQNLTVCTLKTEKDYAAWRDELGGQGFRTLSLSVTTLAPNTPVLYTAVMVKPPAPFAGRSFPSLRRAELDARKTEMAALSPPLYPYIVSATGSGDGVIYAVAFRELPAATEMQPSLTEAEYATAVGQRRAAGELPVWIDSFGTAQNRRLCVIWGKNQRLVAWNAEAVNDKGDVRQQRFDAVTSVGGRPSLLAITPDAGYARLFVDSQLKGGWKSRPAQSVRAFETEAATLATEGLFPSHIASGVINGEFVLSTIYTHSDEVVSRTFRMSGVDLPGLATSHRTKRATIDDWMRAYLAGHNMRGAAVGIVKGTRLVFARGYTWAEPDYPDIQPTTLFRLASVSKSYCAAAAWKALLDSARFNRDSRMQAILNLKQSNGQAPSDDRFADITVRHLLENNSGIDQDSYRNIMAERRDSDASPKPPQPASVGTLLSVIAERTMDHDPGEAASYGRTDYILLGEVAKVLTRASSFDAALKTLVLDPLVMTRTRGARSRIEDRASDEALHQMKAMPTSPSAVHGDRRLVPIQYGGQNWDVFDGAGGISSGAVDLARFAAMLSCRTGNPVLPENVLRTWLQEAVASKATHGGHAHHGFDQAIYWDWKFFLEKGGGLDGAGSGLWGYTDDYFIVIVRNGEKEESAPEDWKNGLYDIAKTIDWGTQDLFPHYGMPTLLSP
jgi:CubicO group peptidase (beta-lactamase class C family)